jgi:hypothetical protein
MPELAPRPFQGLRVSRNVFHFIATVWTSFGALPELKMQVFGWLAFGMPRSHGLSEVEPTQAAKRLVAIANAFGTRLHAFAVQRSHV